MARTATFTFSDPIPYEAAIRGAEVEVLPTVKGNFRAKLILVDFIDNIRRDPFEGAAGDNQTTTVGFGGSLGGPATAFQFDWNLLPIGQLLWLKELESYKEFPPMQTPGSCLVTGSQASRPRPAGGTSAWQGPGQS